VIIDHVRHAGWTVNSWLVAGREEGRGLIIDTGADPPKILEMVRRHGVSIEAIVCTHRHYDHTAGNEFLARNLGCPVVAHPAERVQMKGPTEAVDAGHTWRFSSWSAEVIPLPGHTEGQIGIYVRDVGVWTADTLFKNSVGGTLAPGHGTFEQLRSSIMDQILSLPSETTIYPGHGETTTVSHERERNPFVRVWREVDKPSTRPGRYEGKRVTIEVWAKDYDGGHKAQVRFLDDSVQIVPGSRVQKVTL